jgi:hypothetical protein
MHWEIGHGYRIRRGMGGCSQLPIIIRKNIVENMKFQWGKILEQDVKPT